ncbi:MAG TPA: family 43 glycosylhydrolase [Pirellulales bacterium]|nr:family 43 glycosylhydrolase [Pirellulales bacterium]
MYIKTNRARQSGETERGNHRVLLIAIVCATLVACPRHSFAQLSGEIDAHDPSDVIEDGSTYYYFATGQGIVSRSSTDLTSWTTGPSVFATQPAWTTAAVPGFSGFFWAPDVIFQNNQYYMYYAVSTFGSKVSAIGLATSPTLNPSAPNYAWTDQGAVIQSGNSSNFNAIDPYILQDTDGHMWMSYGSYNAGIFVVEMDPSTGKRLAGAVPVNVADNTSIEASALIKHGNYYYLMVNWGTCCSGIDSTYEVRMGRSTSPTGPFLDQNGVNLLNGGGTLFYDDDGARVGPGQFAFSTNNGQDQFSYHYYDGNRNGAPTFGLSNLYWTADGWPSVAPVNPNWSGSTSSNWSATGNWSSSQVPSASGSVANFGTNSSNHYSVNLDSPQTISRINFLSSASYTIGANGGNVLTFVKMEDDPAATINVSAGSHTIAAPITTTNDLGINVTPAASILTLSGSLSGVNLYKYGFGTLTLGGTDTYTGQVFTHAGTLQITGTTNISGILTAGQTTGDVGTIIVSGNAVLHVSSDLNVGDTGNSATPATGTLMIENNAVITVGASGAFVVGSGFFSNTAAMGTVQQSGGTLTANGNFDGAFVIGGRGSRLGTGIYNLSGGTVNANTDVFVGGYGAGTFNQTGGTFTSNSYVSIGRYAGSTGIWNISAGLLNVNNSSRWLLVGESGTGTLNSSGTGQVTTANVMRVGHNGGSGTINLNGGTLTTLGIQRGTGTATINFNGGTLSPTINSTTFLQGLTTASVQAGGAIIDTSGKSITLGQSLIHYASLGSAADGGLTKSGLGTLTLSAANTYSGGTIINGGALAVNSSILGSVTVNSGGTLQGAGSVGGLVTVKSGGVLAPGNSLGAITFGSLALNSGAQTNIEIGGTTRGSQYDAVLSNGAVSLNGSLTVSLINNFSPAPGVATSFDLLDWGTLSGRFSSTQLPSLTTPMGWDLSQLYSTGVITATPYIPGDFNRDGHVDAADILPMEQALTNLSAYKTTYKPNLTDAQVLLIGDLDGDHKFSNADLQALLNLLQSGGGSANPVPEPSSWILLLLGVIGGRSIVRRLLSG